MSLLTVLVGIPASGKSQLAQQLIEGGEQILIDADEENGERSGARSTAKAGGESAISSTLERLEQALKSGRSIVLQAKHRSPKYRRPYLELAKKHGYRTEAIYLNVPLEQAIGAEQTRRERGESARPDQELRRCERLLQIPTLAESFDRVEVRTPERVNGEAAAFFREQEDRLLGQPVQLIRELEADGRLEGWLPELHRAIPIDQHNPHHRFTIYEHILKATETVAGTSLKMVWTMLLHDIGKAYPGIKQFTGKVQTPFGRYKARDEVIIENGADIREGRDPGDFYLVDGEQILSSHIRTDLDGHFYDHENLGAQLSFRILTRFGYPHDFALEVATLIQFHMLMPRDIEHVDLSQIRKFYRRTGRYAAELMMVRLADSRGK